MRIVGGRLRGRALAAPKSQSIRPTADRLRESLFNILMHAYGDPISGARVLDLFAGTGALGLEALSRGAASATLVERDVGLAAALRATVARLPGGEAAQVVQADALGWLGGQAEAGYDLAFVDPPFAAGLWDAVWPALLPKLAAGAWLYVEAPQGVPIALPPDWLRHREGGTREVSYALYRRRPAG